MNMVENKALLLLDLDEDAGNPDGSVFGGALLTTQLNCAEADRRVVCCREISEIVQVLELVQASEVFGKHVF